jgi:hypothetical protein
MHLQPLLRRHCRPHFAEVSRRLLHNPNRQRRFRDLEVQLPRDREEPASKSGGALMLIESIVQRCARAERHLQASGAPKSRVSGQLLTGVIGVQGCRSELSLRTELGVTAPAAGFPSGVASSAELPLRSLRIALNTPPLPEGEDPCCASEKPSPSSIAGSISSACSATLYRSIRHAHRWVGCPTRARTHNTDAHARTHTAHAHKASIERFSRLSGSTLR